MQSITRAMSVAKVLAAHANDKGISISELSKQCELPLSTMHRLLQAMIKQSMVEQDEHSKLYRLGMVWLEYGLQVYDTIDYVSKVRPELERLSKDVEESVYLSKPVGIEAMIVERIDSENNPIRIYDQLGLRIPLHIGAANKSILAAMPSSQSESILSQLLPAGEIPNFSQTLSQITKQGYAISHSERTEGTSSVAVSIKDSLGQIIGAISVGVVSFNLTEERLAFLTSKIIETGNNISAKLKSSN
ncbi:IclR family transcriptional regulator [Psychrobacillus psychrodurans]|uniref:IclR family transcriptional regulator n=1 Tax=Psychrobacillus psychrodurans TaxID=126157 RepID=UPI0008E56ABE|nr:IclR family transcriptional regulator [Psychrobacillus psychrodurans]MCZ8542418.1 IclR family transcriptional regulator [Psychrobacillus psychrodurans]SFN22169.1 DNA-binding transcriptional regulator, IclR family [Psychrobacillus psychrodurans]